MTDNKDDRGKKKIHKLVGAGIGWFVAGPVGAALGLLVGHTMENNPELLGSVVKGKSLREYYDILQIPYNANVEEIKAAYKKMAQKFHPDRFVDNADPVIEELAREKMCRINEAYAAIMEAVDNT